MSGLRVNPWSEWVPGASSSRLVNEPDAISRNPSPLPYPEAQRCKASGSFLFPPETSGTFCQVDLLILMGLVIQALALFLLFRRVGRTWSTHVGAIFIVLATAYHGLNEILLWLFPDRDVVRRLVSGDFLAQFVTWISVAILLVTLAYIAFLGPSQRDSPAVADSQRTLIARVFDWRVMLIAPIVLMIPTLAGARFALDLSAAAPQTLDFGAGLALQFLLVAIVLASFGIISRFGRGWLLPVLFVQSAVMTILGSRLEILAAALMLLYLLARAGVSIKRAQLALGIGGFLLVALVLTSARATEGRISGDAGGSLRVDWLASGIANVGSPQTWDLIAADLGYRLDGNSFGAMELKALDGGQPALGTSPVINDLLLAMPSFLNPDKNNSAVETRSAKLYAEIYLALPINGLQQDILPTQLGGVTGLWGPWGLLIVALFLGAVFGLADRWLTRQLTPSRLLIGVGLLFSVALYEASWDIYFVTFRGILLLLPLVWLIQKLRTPKVTVTGPPPGTTLHKPGILIGT